MKRVFFLTSFIVALALNIFGLEEKGKATIYTSDSKIIQTDEIAANFGKKWNVTVIMDDGERIKSNLVINDIKRLEVIKWDNEEEWWIEGKVILQSQAKGEKTDAAPNNAESTDTSSSGPEFMIIANPDSLFQRDGNYVVYKKYDPINNELVGNRIWSKSIVSVEFGTNTGSYKVDSLGHKFTPDYIYSPYTGEKMEFGNSSGQFKVDSSGNRFNPEYIFSPYTGEKMELGGK